MLRWARAWHRRVAPRARACGPWLERTAAAMARSLVVQLTAPVSNDAAEQAVQRTLHLRWLGVELLTDA